MKCLRIRMALLRNTRREISSTFLPESGRLRPGETLKTNLCVPTAATVIYELVRSARVSSLDAIAQRNLRNVSLVD